MATPKKNSRKSETLKTLGKHPKGKKEILVKNGRYGPYITDGKINVKIPKGKTPETVTLKEAVELIDKKKKK